ncbi:unnamed protein product, partial [Cladocopium goreaui]
SLMRLLPWLQSWRKPSSATKPFSERLKELKSGRPCCCRRCRKKFNARVTT